MDDLKKTKKVFVWSRMLVCVCAGFILLCAFSLLNEFLDLPHILLGAPQTPINRTEAIIESIFIVIVGFFLVLILIRAITKCSRAEKETNKLLKTIETAKEGISIASADGTIIYTNDAMDKLSGYEKGELIGEKPAILNAGPRPEIVTKKIMDAIEKNGDWEGEIHNKRKDGTEFISYARISALRDDNGKIINFLSTQHDITERKHAEEKLRLQGEIMANMVEGVVLTRTSDGIIVYTNPKFEKMFGYGPGEMLGKNISMVNASYKETAEEVAKKIQKSLYKDGVWQGEVYNIKKDGTPFWCFAGVSTFRHYDYGEVWVAVHTDITERKKIEQALQKAYDELERRVEERTAELAKANEQLQLDIAEREKLKLREREHQAELAHYSRLSTIGEMASALAHELNQPLCAIASYAKGTLRMMKAGAWDSNELLEAMEEAGIQAERAGKIVNRIGKLVRKKEPHRSGVDIEDIIDEAVSMMESEARLKGITIKRVKPSEKVPMFEADAIQIEQVLLNLLRNSFEAMDDINESKRRVAIEVSTDEDGAVQVAISDTGKGLSAENIDRVFEPFFTTKSEGLGMGLSISQSVIEAHKGRIWAERSSAGGAIFRFTLPTEGRAL